MIVIANSIDWMSHAKSVRGLAERMLLYGKVEESQRMQHAADQLEKRVAPIRGELRHLVPANSTPAERMTRAAKVEGSPSRPQTAEGHEKCCPLISGESRPVVPGNDNEDGRRYAGGHSANESGTEPPARPDAYPVRAHAETSPNAEVDTPIDAVGNGLDLVPPNGELSSKLSCEAFRSEVFRGDGRSCASLATCPCSPPGSSKWMPG